MSAKDTATTLWSELVRERAGGCCERCGSRLEVDAHHIFNRNRLATRTDESNGIALCRRRCHIGFAHAEPFLFEGWIRDRMGDERYDALQAKSRQTHAGPEWSEEVTRVTSTVEERSMSAAGQDQ